jgi:hypothetical protein
LPRAYVARGNTPLAKRGKFGALNNEAAYSRSGPET